MDRAKKAIKTIGDIAHVKLVFSMPLLYLGYGPGDIRYNYAMGGGVTADMGCYCIDAMRFLTGMEMEVKSARSFNCAKDVDLTMRADFAFSNGATGHMYCSFYSLNPLRWFNMYADIRGVAGRIYIQWPFQPQIINRITVWNKNGKTTERIKSGSTYYYQLKAIAGHILKGELLPINLNDSINAMKLIDDVYRMAGLRLRGEK